MFHRNYVYLYYMEKDIINEYLNNNMSIEKLSLKYKIGKIKLKKILSDNSIDLKQRGGQQKHIFTPFKYNLTDKIVECKVCSKQYNDIENKSGSLIEHMKICYPTVKIPSKLFRSNYKNDNGEYWHFQYFKIIDKPENVDTLKCPECEWLTTDLTNKTGSFTKHILKSHGDVELFINEHTNLSHLFSKLINKLVKIENLKNDHVICKICNEKLKSINNIHLKKHNITLNRYKQKYLGETTCSISTIDKLKLSYDNNLRLYEPDYKSKAENEISEIIRSHGFIVENNNKKILNGTEIDIFIPEINVGIEYNGLYYHTEKLGKDKHYHLNKQNLAKEKNIKLIHLFEDEWLDKKEICVSKIIHLIGKNNSEKIYARKTSIKLIGIKDTLDFLNKNHIQGFSNKTTCNIGSYYNNELIGVMSFYKEQNKWILNRMSTDINYYCVGVTSKMFSYFNNNINKENLDVITFADRNWVTDKDKNIYTTLGFKLNSILKPDYKYFNPKISRNNRLHKFNFRKKILCKKYPDILNMNMTENEMTKIIGCNKIWDCGLFKYVYTKKGTN